MKQSELCSAPLAPEDFHERLSNTLANLPERENPAPQNKEESPKK